VTGQLTYQSKPLHYLIGYYIGNHITLQSVDHRISSKAEKAFHGISLVIFCHALYRVLNNGYCLGVPFCSKRNVCITDGRLVPRKLFSTSPPNCSCLSFIKD